MAYSYVIADSSQCGSVYARQMAEKGYKVLVLERKNHVGGNMIVKYSMKISEFSLCLSKSDSLWTTG